MDEIDLSEVDYPGDACAARNLIRDAMRPYVDKGTSMDGGGGFGQADLWMTVGGVEYLVSVKPTRCLGAPSGAARN